MRFVGLATLAIVAVTVVSACGSLPRRVVYNESPDIYRTRNHQYSVGQVEAAFARQGIRLHKLRREPVRFVFLGSGRLRHFVTLGVSIGSTRHIGYARSLNGDRPFRVSYHGNVSVFYDPSHSVAVKSAFTELR